MSTKRPVIVVAPNAFKETFSPVEAARLIRPAAVAWPPVLFRGIPPHGVPLI